MYNDYFGFKEAPFSIAPDPRYLYMTSQHREALAHLVYGLNSEGGCILLTGEVGTGKTTICRCLLNQLPDNANVALVLNPKVSEVELLETICDELKISYPDSDNTVKTYTDRIYDYLIESHRKNKKIVLIIDEAQNLDRTVLEQLRLLTNLETNQQKLLQIIILGQPELLEILARSDMRQLAQRITARFHLKPLSRDEVKAYVSHRLAVSGQNIQLFPEKSIKLLYKLSHGIPRLINIICDRALLGAYVESQYSVSPSIIKKAAAEVFGELKNVTKLQKKKNWAIPLTVAAGIILIFFAGIITILNFSDDGNENKIIATQSTEIQADSTTNESVIKKETVTAEDNTDIHALADTREITGNSDIDADMIQIEEQVAVDSKTPVPSGISDNTSVNQIDEILNSSTNNPATAYQQLFKTWGKQYDTKAATTACRQAKPHALSCLHKQGNLNSLKAHNRPAVLTLFNNKGEPRHVTVTEIIGDTATVFFNNSMHRLKLDDLDRYWYGQYILLWQKPASYVSAVSPGGNGEIINWLNEKLNIVNKIEPSNTPINSYSKPLVEKVKSFQLKQQLTADGIVGPLTIIHLNTESGMQAPTLVPPSKPELTNKQG